MLSITQAKKTTFAASQRAKYKKTPNVKTLGRVQTIVVPCEKLSKNCEPAHIQTILLDEASKLACRIAILNGDTMKNDDPMEEINEDNLRHYLEHSLPVISEKIREQIITGDADAQKRNAATETGECATCNCREIGDEKTDKKTTMIVHEWSNDHLDKFVYNIEGREHRHIVFAHPCCRGNIKVDISNNDANTEETAAPKNKQITTDRLAAATNSILKDKHKSVPFMTELIEKISKCQAQQCLSEESIEQRIERVRLEKIARQEDAHKKQIEELNRLICDTKMNLGSRKTELPTEEDVSSDSDDSENLDAEESSEQSSLLSESEENSYDDDEEEKVTLHKPQGDVKESKQCNYLFSFRKKATDINPKVYVYGDFNNWSVDSAFELCELGNTGVFVYLATIDQGTYDYLFLVDGEQRVNPNKPTRYCTDWEQTLNTCKVTYNELLAELKEEETKKVVEQTKLAEDDDDEFTDSYDGEDERADSDDDETTSSEEDKSTETTEKVAETRAEDETQKTCVKEPIDNLVKENYKQENVARQFCADFMMAVCEPGDEFCFFKKLNCPFILQWSDEKRNSIYIFRRFYENYYSWTFRQNQSVNFQLLATLKGCN